jgi:hypothetical protein
MAHASRGVLLFEKKSCIFEDRMSRKNTKKHLDFFSCARVFRVARIAVYYGGGGGVTLLVKKCGAKI